jgi:hypothetical protein
MTRGVKTPTPGPSPVAKDATGEGKDRGGDVPGVLAPEESITAILDGRGLPFVPSRSKQTFYLRPPNPDEYDDAMALQTLVRRRTLAQPQVAELRQYPMTPEHRAGIEATIRDLEKREAELTDAETRRPGDTERDDIRRRIGEYREMLDGRRTLAEQTADERATLARDRWLLARLLTDENGRQVFDANGPQFEEQWRHFPVRLKNEARPLIWLLLRMLENASFLPE